MKDEGWAAPRSVLRGAWGAPAWLAGGQVAGRPPRAGPASGSSVQASSILHLDQGGRWADFPTRTELPEAHPAGARALGAPFYPRPPGSAGWLRRTSAPRRLPVDTSAGRCYTGVGQTLLPSGSSSVGRARLSQSRGRRFESGLPLQCRPHITPMCGLLLFALQYALCSAPTRRGCACGEGQGRLSLRLGQRPRLFRQKGRQRRGMK